MKNWEEEFDNTLVDWNSPRFLANGKTVKDIKQFINNKLKEQLEEHIKLSDKIEDQYPNEFNEWRAFKGFRNALRDKLKSME